METTGFLGGINSIFEWITRLALLNLLWLFFTVIGLFVFGFFPATVAMFAVVRKWALGELDISITKTFWQSYRHEFMKSNILGLWILLISCVLFIDYIYLQHTTDMKQLLTAPFFIVTLLFACMLFYIFPMYVHYEMKISQLLKSSFFVMIMNPISTCTMLVGTSGLLFLLSYGPPLMIVCSGNVIALAIVKPAINAFNKINRKYQFMQQ
ncbi:YesL family protein [Metabacillus malikii]|uniref:Membrane protein YesL n=1 Tax=Metabacillus malikii TaxID=1504265 RepID=A0ABT9ZKM3_9BACI|nr:DUF624 domain-containing protein [Metabacillus malikii]MDQ0232530.1 putative membrane protein YesL [Metabacillus malikii]